MIAGLPISVEANCCFESKIDRRTEVWSNYFLVWKSECELWNYCPLLKLQLTKLELVSSIDWIQIVESNVRLRENWSTFEQEKIRTRKRNKIWKSEWELKEYECIRNHMRNSRVKDYSLKKIRVTIVQVKRTFQSSTLESKRTRRINLNIEK